MFLFGIFNYFVRWKKFKTEVLGFIKSVRTLEQMKEAISSKYVVLLNKSTVGLC